MDRQDTTQIDLLQHVVSRLQSQLGLTAQQVFIAWGPRDPAHIPRSGDVFIGVSPEDSTFIPGEQVAGNITEEWTFAVAIYVRAALDRPDEAAVAITDLQRGLFSWKKRVLAALAGWDVGLGQRALVHCVRAEAPQALQAVGDQYIALWSLTLHFALPFDWALG